MNFPLLDKYLAPGEDWDLLCQRVSGLMQYREDRELIYDDLVNLRWLPNSPALVNSGRPGGRNLMACHALHIDNSIEGIFEAVKQTAIITKSGGGLGLEFSDLSPRGTALKYAPQGVASGPVSFLRMFDTTAQVVMEGGLRRAAMLASLNANHPDILDFIKCKETDGLLSNFNMTVTLDNGPDSIKPEVWDAIVKHAWYNGEPGIGFLDNINSDNPVLKEYGPIKALNACCTGDTLIAVADGREAIPIKQLAEECKDIRVYCQNPDGMAAIRMARHPRKTRTNVPILKLTFANGYSIRTTPDHRLMRLNGIYGQVKDLKSGDKLMPFNNQFKMTEELYHPTVVSIEPCGSEDVYNITVDDYHNLAYITNKERGCGIISRNCAEQPLYHAGSCVLASIVLPNVITDWCWDELYSVAGRVTRFLNRVIDTNHYPMPEIAQSTRRTRDIGVGIMGFDTLLRRENIPYTSLSALSLATEIGKTIHFGANHESVKLAKRDGGYLPNRRRNARLTTVAPTGHISRLAGVSFSMYPDLSEALVMTPTQHLDMISAWQKHCDSSISYTVNIPNDASPSVVDAVLRGAYERGIKVLSVYRDGSRKDQPCTADSCDVSGGA